MNIKINGKSKLDSNDYERLVIRYSDEKYLVNVNKKRTSFPTVKLNNIFSDRLKKVSPEEQVIEIIDYFLRNNQINEISDFKYLSHYEGVFTAVKSNRSIMALQIPRRIKNDDILNNIIFKYRNDRYNFLEKNKNINSFEISIEKDSSSYSRRKLWDNEDYESYIKLCIRKSFDDKFLKEFLFEKLYEQGYNAYLKESFIINNDIGYIGLGWYILCGNLKIKVDEKIVPFVMEIIKKYNLEINDIKKKQLKLEGF